MDAGLKRVLEAKVYAGERLTREDGAALLGCDDLAWLGRLAHHRRTELNGDRVTFGTRADPATEVPYGSIGDLERLRETGGVVTVLPVPAGASAPAETLKTVAVIRLFLADVPHVRVSWPVHGSSVAQLALNFGADDLAAPADAETDDILHLIWDAGLRPVERDARYQVVREYEKAPSLAERRSEPQKIWA